MTERASNQAADRVAYLREQLAARESYGTGDSPEAEAIRTELAELTRPARRGKKEADRG